MHLNYEIVLRGKDDPTDIRKSGTADSLVEILYRLVSTVEAHSSILRSTPSMAQYHRIEVWREFLPIIILEWAPELQEFEPIEIPKE